MQKGLIVGDFDLAIVEWLVDPFHFYDRKIRRRLKLKLIYEKTLTFPDIENALKQHKPDVLFFTIGWAIPGTEKTRPVEEIVDWLKSLYESADRPKIVYLDHYCQTSTPFFAALPYVDVYVRKQLLTPLSEYNDRDFIGKNVISDFNARHYGRIPDGWEFGSKIPEGFEHRLMPGWNLGTAATLSRPARYPLLRKLMPRAKKTLDLTCRLTVREAGDEDADSVYFVHRTKCLEAVSALENKLSVAHNANGERVPYKQFQRELRESHMVLSPFGWGEITDRDFRVINARSLLVKPDMSHMETYPDVFRAGETYAPVKWDFSDLGDVCEYYLSHPAEAREMTENAVHVYDEYFRKAKFVDKIEEILQRLENI